jgi:hypothetical protein
MWNLYATMAVLLLFAASEVHAECAGANHTVVRNEKSQFSTKRYIQIDLEFYNHCSSSSTITATVQCDGQSRIHTRFLKRGQTGTADARFNSNGAGQCQIAVSYTN